MTLELLGARWLGVGGGLEEQKLTICLHTLHLGLLFYADILPRHHIYVGHLKSMCCPNICCLAGWRGTSMLPCGGTDAGWKPGGSKICEKSSLLSVDWAASSEDDRATSTGWRVACIRRACANSLQMRVTSVIHPLGSLVRTGGGVLPTTSRVISSGLKDAKGERSSKCVSPCNLAVNCARTNLVAGQWQRMYIVSPSTVMLAARQCGQTLSL